LQKAPKAPNPHTIEREPVTIEEQAALIMALFAYREEISFSELVAGTDRSTLVVTFLALLEMMRSHNVKIRQQEQFGEIYLCKPVQTEIDESLENVTTKEYPADNAEILNDDDGISSLKELKQRERLARRAHKISLEANRQGDKKPVLFDTN
jgi:segregation and condensation protein A